VALANLRCINALNNNNNNNVNCAADLDGSLVAPRVDKSLSSTDRLAAVKSVLQATDQLYTDRCTATIFDAKEQYKVLCRCCAIALCTRCVDPKVACWLLDPASNEKNLHCLVTNYCPLETSLFRGEPFLIHTSHRSALATRVFWSYAVSGWFYQKRTCGVCGVCSTGQMLTYGVKTVKGAVNISTQYKTDLRLKYAFSDCQMIIHTRLCIVTRLICYIIIFDNV